MRIEEDKPLAEFNTLGLNVCACYFIEIDSVAQAQEALKFSQQKQCPLLILGGGSNLVLINDYPGLVMQNRIMGISLVEESADTVLVEVGAGESWHKLVNYTLAHGWYGLENLALIPGCVGAAPIQNIGAYGVELHEVFSRLRALDVQTGQLRTFSNTECQFGYRDSVFKRELKDGYLITSVTLQLRKQAKLNIDYSALRQALAGESDITPERVRDVVCEIRRAKLPDPDAIGNVGSFFKNPVVSERRFHALKQEFSEIVGFSEGDGTVKLAAGWLIEHCGWKGYRLGDVGVHPAQALVLVNYASARPAAGTDVPEQLLTLAGKIRDSVKQRFDVLLEAEPRIIPEPIW